MKANSATESQWARPLLETLLKNRGLTFLELFDLIWADSMSRSGGYDMQRINAWLTCDDFTKIGAVRRIGRVIPFVYEARFSAGDIDRLCELQSGITKSRSQDNPSRKKKKAPRRPVSPEGLGAIAV